MPKRRGGSLPRVMAVSRNASGLDVRMVIPGLPIAVHPADGISRAS
jgi:hypothetical protein